MKLRKILASGALCALLLTALVLPASAHHGGRHHGANGYAVCTVEDCTQTGWHTHGGAAYCGHSHGHHGGHC